LNRSPRPTNVGKRRHGWHRQGAKAAWRKQTGSLRPEGNSLWRQRKMKLKETPGNR
jgi:hypothetical protein